jgi:hypothetical protein
VTRPLIRVTGILEKVKLGVDGKCEVLTYVVTLRSGAWEGATGPIISAE